MTLDGPNRQSLVFSERGQLFDHDTKLPLLLLPLPLQQNQAADLGQDRIFRDKTAQPKDQRCDGEMGL